MDDAYAAYLSDNSSYAAYTAAYNSYDRAFDRYGGELDTCWEEYQATQ